MSGQRGANRSSDLSHRRSFLTASLAMATIAFTGSATLSAIGYAQVLTKAQRDKMSPSDVLTLMKKGNERFYRGKPEPHNFLAEQRASAGGQYPAAVLLSCIDSRVAAETIMDLEIGDIFDNRVAGNVENPDVLGGMEFACKLEGAKVVLVMGHTTCGAVTGAIANEELGNLTGLLAKIRPAIEATTYQGERTSQNVGFVNAVARKNVELTLANIRKGSPVLASMESSGTIKIAGAMYNLKTGVVDFFAG